MMSLYSHKMTSRSVLEVSGILVQLMDDFLLQSMWNKPSYCQVDSSNARERMYSVIRIL
ncbi:hypothetical protein HMI54_012484 [Coelomomyces lativittatus]|nr:hypothetical protein HMI56_004926 [Coelomomyces lativittatus]KAJ1498681.1 hypothetical protein HMI54_012484 [Coelomomyces lativittatus]